jgi:hypothetical protein
MCKTTVTAFPAGFGKTTLLSEWVADYGRPVVRRSRTKATTTRPTSSATPSLPSILGHWVTAPHTDPVKSNDNVTEAGSFYQKIMLPACLLLSLILGDLAGALDRTCF